MITTYERRMNAAYQLQADSYNRTKQTRGKHITHTPCKKALVLQHSKEPHMGKLECEVLATECICHPGLTHSQLLDMEFDATAKHAHWGVKPCGLFSLKGT